MSMLRETLIHCRAAESPPDAGCHSAGESVPALSIHTRDGERWVLPWSHFVSARHRGDGGRERLTLLFASHEVELQGVRLAALLPEIARFRLGSLRSLPAKYESHGGDCEPFIERLSVRPTGGPPAGGTAFSG